MLLRIALITAFYFGLLLDMHFANGGWKQTLDLINLLIMLASWVFLVSFFFAIESVFSHRKSRWINSGLTFLYVLLAYYQRNTGQSFDYSIVANNWQATTNMNTLSETWQIAHNIFIASNLFWALVISGLIFWSYRRHPKAEFIAKHRRSVPAAAIAIGVLLMTTVGYSHDQYSRLGRSFVRYYFPIKTHLDEIASKLEPLPEVTVQSKFSTAKPPHIFVVMVESLNARFIGQKHESGRAFMPYFESLIAKGTYAKNYFSPSVQTAKGHFGILCGQAPSQHSIEFRSADCAVIECLPSLLKNRGYQTYFMQAHGDPNFDNERNFLLKRGIDEAPMLAKSCRDEAEPCFGWGIRDDVFYKRVFDYLNEKSASPQPVFAAMATISSHQPFMAVPPDQREFYPDQRSRREGYLNHMKFVDEGLRVFMEQLQQSEFGKNAVVIITGDHGFPLGEHGNSHNENYAFNENFQVPLLILDLRPGAAAPVVLDQPLSHLNLPATILDLSGFSGETPFIAPSVFAGDGYGPVYLVQPYSGGYLAVVDGEFKYVFDATRGVEQVYNLQSDPAEMRDVLSTVDSDILVRLRTAAAQIKKQQEVLACE